MTNQISEEIRTAVISESVTKAGRARAASLRTKIAELACPDKTLDEAADDPAFKALLSAYFRAVSHGETVDLPALAAEVLS